MQVSLHDVGGQVLRVGVRTGDRTRPPLLLFNGIGANIELVEPFLDALDDLQAIVFDVPGVSGSPPPWLPYRPSTVARLTARLLDNLDINRSMFWASPGAAHWRSNLRSNRVNAAGASCWPLP